MTNCWRLVRGTNCGVAFDEQIVSEIPVEPHDIHVELHLDADALDRAIAARGYGMMLLANILEGAALFACGAVLSFLLVLWRNRASQEVRSRETQALVDTARKDADTITRDARLAANEEAMKLREQTEQSFARRHTELGELERRLGEREVLINSQLQRAADAEKELNTQKETLRIRAETLAEKERELTELVGKRREQLQELARLERGRSARKAFAGSGTGSVARRGAI